MLQRKVSLARLNTFGFDISADIFDVIRDANVLKSYWKTTLLAQSNPLILGGGSNIVFTKDYPGLVLHNQIEGKEILQESENDVLVRIGGGENWHQTVLWAVSQGWGGIENLSLIPGSMGAAPIQNIGAYGVELESAFHALEAFDMLEGKSMKFVHSECRFGYRDSIFKNEARGRYFITHVILKLSKKPVLHIEYGDIKQVLEEQGISQPGIADISAAVIKIRQSKLPDPAEIGNCGSFFKNPVIPNHQFELLKQVFPDVRSFPSMTGYTKVPAAWLIEQAGWKGFRRGDAGVHTRQALVLVNYGQAAGEEIRSLAKEMEVNLR
jgi:UDP-N-acetylmuramate dehydrogenase